MIIKIESTGMIGSFRGVACRVWRGVTESGIKCDLLVPILRVKLEADQAEFEAELEAMEPLQNVVDFRKVF
jgi:hypothetical protein